MKVKLIDADEAFSISISSIFSFMIVLGNVKTAKFKFMMKEVNKKEV
jgi:hypothetical protein